MWAPFSTNNCAISTWPFSTALSNAVPPYYACTKLVKYTIYNQIAQNEQILLSAIPFNFLLAAQSHTLPVEAHVSCSIAHALQCINLVQHHKYCSMCPSHQPSVSAGEPFPHIALAYVFIQFQCPDCVHPCKKGILHGKFELWMPHVCTTLL